MMGPTDSPPVTPPTETPLVTASPLITPTPTPTLMMGPTDSPPVAPPTEVPAWGEFGNELAALGFSDGSLPIIDDSAGDALNANNGEPRQIAGELDMLATYAGWTLLHGSTFDPGGLFDCADHEVFCGEHPVELTDQDVVLAAVQTNGHIPFGDHPGRSIAIAFDRTGHENAPTSFGPFNFGGFDLAVIAATDAPGLIALEYDPSVGNFVRIEPPGRVRIVGDTAVFVVHLIPDEEPTVLFLSAQDGFRCHSGGGTVTCTPPPDPSKTTIDMAPADGSYPIDASLGPQAP